MPNPSPDSTFGRRASSAFKRLIVALLVLALAGAVVFLLSQLNARTYSLEYANGKIFILKGRMLPLGAEPYRPQDPALAEAYAPIDTHDHDPGRLMQMRFSEREELDRALFQY